MKDALVSVVAGSNKAELSLEQLEENKNLYEQMYTLSQKNFAQAVVSLVEKVLNVKAFFEHAGGKPELIVSNDKIEDLYTNSRFINYITSLGKEMNDQKIWFAIVPSIYHDEFVKIQGVKKESNFNKLNNLSFNKKTNVNSINNKIKLTPFTSLSGILDLLGKSRIITFFNFKGCEKTSSMYLSSEIIKRYKEELKPIIENEEASEYSVFCYPNFTILPERYSYFKLGDETIPLPPVYLDASYVACGLYVKSQNNDELSKEGFKVNENLGCPVRFDFEGSFKINNIEVQLSQIFHTNINRENILSWSSVKQEIDKDGGFGFCFCDDEVTYRSKTNKDVKQLNAYVYKARTLGRYKVKDENGNETGEVHYRPIYRTFVKSYITNINRLNQGVYTQLENKANTWKSVNSIENINNPIKAGDSIDLNQNKSTKKIEITIKYCKDMNFKEAEFIEI